MKDRTYHNVQEVFNSARTIANCLLERGESDASHEITNVINNFWTTSSEALGEIRLTLLKLRPIVEKNTNSKVTLLLDQTTKGADDLWNRNYNSVQRLVL